MATVYLTSGPRGAGKSTYAKEIISHFPDILLVSRDELLIEVFGKTSLDSYSGGHHYVLNLMFERLKKIFLEDNHARVVLDCWNGFSHERESIIRKLKKIGVDCVVCWMFHIPADQCVKRFMSKPDSKGYNESGQRRDHSLFYRKAKCIEEDGFDYVCHINILQQRLPFMPPMLPV